MPTVAPTGAQPARPPRCAALAARGLSKRFGAHVALREVSFELAPGELAGVVGPNGAGKTTLLSILAGVTAPDTGELVELGGGVGWVPQQPALYAKLSVVENLRLFSRLEGLADPEAAVARMLDQTGLRDRRDDEVGRLSGGSRQRVNIAIGLLSEPALLLLDEPTAALDPRQRERLWEFVAELARRGTTVLFSTHNVAEVGRHADRVLLLADGELLFCGSTDELQRAVGEDLAHPDLEAALLGFLDRHGH